MFSKACEYGIKATIFIVSNTKEGKAVSLKDISDHVNSPSAFTSKILQKLVKEKLIKSTRGTHGGFRMQEDADQPLTVAQIVSAIDGDAIYKGCGLGLEECDERRPCPLHHGFKSVRNGLQALLETTTIEDLAKDLKKGNVFLKL